MLQKIFTDGKKKRKSEEKERKKERKEKRQFQSQSSPVQEQLPTSRKISNSKFNQFNNKNQ